MYSSTLYIECWTEWRRLETFSVLCSFSFSFSFSCTNSNSFLFSYCVCSFKPRWWEKFAFDSIFNYHFVCIWFCCQPPLVCIPCKLLSHKIKLMNERDSTKKKAPISKFLFFFFFVAEPLVTITIRFSLKYWISWKSQFNREIWNRTIRHWTTLWWRNQSKIILFFPQNLNLFTTDYFIMCMSIRKNENAFNFKLYDIQIFSSILLFSFFRSIYVLFCSNAHTIWVEQKREKSTGISHECDKIFRFILLEYHHYTELTEYETRLIWGGKYSFLLNWIQLTIEVGCSIESFSCINNNWSWMVWGSWRSNEFLFRISALFLWICWHFHWCTAIIGL